MDRNNTGQKKKVLIVDDETEIVKFLAWFLRRKNIDVFLATNAGQAWQKFSEFQPELMLLDINMPDMDGLSLLRRIRTQDNKIKIIMVTGSSETACRKEAKKLKVQDYLVKPLDLSVLYSLVNKYLG